MLSQSLLRNSFYYLQVQVMLVVDAILTLITWLPASIYLAVVHHIGASFFKAHTPIQLITITSCLIGLMMTNAFITPIVYFIFNSNFRVSTLWLYTGSVHYFLTECQHYCYHCVLRVRKTLNNVMLRDHLQIYFQFSYSISLKILKNISNNQLRLFSSSNNILKYCYVIWLRRRYI